jgi:dihydrofolate synthase/folylpolyglutamate synthase
MGDAVGPPHHEAVATKTYLDGRAKLGIKFGLEAMRALVEELGHPELRYSTLLIAGPNGKGSVAAYVDAVLRAGPCARGLYTSPHLVRVHERIAVDGREISGAALARSVGRVRQAAPPTRRPKVAHPASHLLRGG